MPKGGRWEDLHKGGQTPEYNLTSSLLYAIQLVFLTRQPLERPSNHSMAHLYGYEGRI